MFRYAPPLRGWLIVLPLLLLVLPVAARAQNEGQADLDRATELKLGAKSPMDLDAVIEHCESSIRKGLDEDNKKFAVNLLTSTLFQRASLYTAQMFADARDPRWQLWRADALRDLDELLEHDPNYVDAHLLIARLEALPGGKMRRGRNAVEKAIELLADDKPKQAEAWVLKAQMSEGEEERVAALDKALELDPGSVQAHQLRAGLFLAKGEVDKAISHMEQILAQHPENLQARAALAEALINLKQYDKALAQIDEAIKLNPESPIGYLLKSQLHMAKEEPKEAKAALDKLLEVEPGAVLALLMRARVQLADGNSQAALEDVNRVLAANPEQPPVQAILLRSMIYADQQQFDRAIIDMRLLVENDPENSEWRLQLASFYNASGRPRKAIEIYNEMIEQDADDWRARRGRADAELAIGQHAEAIADYKVAHAAQPEHSGILNNYAWVLATSPKDELRDAKRSIELATKACEVTEYKEAHILSTLAAGYAESGDFETAIKWSTKAVELGEGETREQLQKELESYQQKKPWRELQETKEKPDVPSRPRNRIAA
ncbi:MAG: tetratricopeptide repeat protein [Pirellulaceae bacterium]|nr:tetratricopeptide repeat protein [Pirellulaceae bacterium]